MNPNFIVWALVVLTGLSSVGYGLQGDYMRMAYWLGAFLTTGSTIFIGR